MEPNLKRLTKIENAEVPKTRLPKVASKEIHYFDEEGKVCDREHAVKFVATAFDKEGRRIHETWGTCNQEQKDTIE